MRIPSWSEITRIFSSRPAQTQERTFREISAVGGANSDWPLTFTGTDSQIWQNVWALTTRVRDLFNCNPLFQSYREAVWSNVLGARGPMLRMESMETEDRVVNSKEEERAIKDYEERENLLEEFCASETGREFKRKAFLHVTGHNGSRIASVKLGDPDVYANELITRRWKEWQRREFCDARGARNYQTIRQLRLISAVRDGDFFLRMVRGSSVNKFGFTLQLINAEWCDRFLNTILSNGNEVRMGIEYQFSPWGIGKPVAYYFIRRQPMDWQWGIPGAIMTTPGTMHQRILAEEIVHYARAVDADATRPAPWVASAIPSARQLDQAMLAEVIAWRESACKTGFYYSDVNPEGGMATQVPNPRVGIPTEEMAPGEKRGLPWGVKFQPNDPTHPNASVKDFRMAALQGIVSGMPGASYPSLANDWGAVNFAAGRLSRLDSNECYMMLQEYDCAYAENLIFEAWLEMALTVGAIPLPLASFPKYNNKTFAYRSWRGVDEVKEATASALRVANHQSNDFIECEAVGLSLPEVLKGQAEANRLKELYGITIEKTVESGAPKITDTPDIEEGQTTTAASGADATAKKPAAKKTRKARIEQFTEEAHPRG